MKARAYPAAAILAGLTAALMVSAIHIFISNAIVFQKAAIVLKTGYLSVPNAQVAQTLKTVQTAFCGAIFFTLSIGAGLGMLSFFCFWIWDRVFSRGRRAGRILLFLWLLLLLIANINGMSPAAVAHILFTPLSVCGVMHLLMPVKKTPLSFKTLSPPIIGFFLLTALWCTQLGSHMFINIRDNLLLTNRFGVAINDFYYQYTLYAAEAFKPLGMKTIKTADLDDISEPFLYSRLEKTLRSRDYLPVKGFSKPDIHIEKDKADQSLVFKHTGKTVLKIPSGDFIKNPDLYLSRFSAASDTNVLFRRMTFAGLLVGYPMILYLFVFTAAAMVWDLFLPRDRSTWAAAVFCLAAGIALLYPVYKANMYQVRDAVPETDLYAKSPLVRARAIRKIMADKIDIAVFKGYETARHSPFMPERYYLARAMGKSRDNRSYALLTEMLKDKSPNVVCQALWALGQKGRPQGADIIINTIKTADHWYVQWYGYRALRKLGWVQKKSI